MNWDDLRIVAAVRDAGTFAGAGKILRLDETTVARRLSRLQRSLGITLFDAIDGIRRPTARCEAVLAEIDDIRARVEKIGAVCSSYKGPSGTVRVATTPSIAEAILAPVLGDFLMIHPGLALDFRTANENVNFARWEADLAIRLGKPQKGAFVIRKLAELRLYLFRPIERSSASADDIACVYPKELGTTPEMHELATSGLAESARLVTGDLKVIRAVINSGKGAGVLPDFLAKPLLGDRRFTVTALPARREVWLLIQPHLKNEPAARLVIDWIAATFADLDH
ncbi:MAG: LysR family transcriptional regulator [Hyphomicrobiales bacterium]|nr:LysR family transcriptional regulator [Hyphomicrobiales bacterium]